MTMPKTAVIFFIFLCIADLCKGIDISRLKLEQVLILSRHNIRTPLTEGLEQYSAKNWPKWNLSAGLLTEKGALMEGYMGKYIAAWLAMEDVIAGCPNDDEVHIYANTRSRTIASAKAFTESAFPLCNITISHYKNLSVFDPIFLPIYHNTEETFKKEIKEAMTRKLNELDLTDAYSELNKILDIENASICKELYFCDLVNRKTEAIVEDGEEPNVNGPLFIGNSVVDSFLMSYYEGMPPKDIAWGEIETDDKWKLLSDIIKANQNVRFSTGTKDLAGPLLNYIFDIFKYGTPKFTLLMGHDSNLNTVMKALDFKPYVLPNQIEPFPIGGKLVFQKWTADSEDYLKIEYIYPTFLQLRNGANISLQDPPERVTLELNKCQIDSNGYCLWNNFMKLNVFS